MDDKPRVIAAMDTPLTDDGERLAEDRIGPLIDFLLQRGVKGLFIAGSTGLGPLLSDEEWKLLVRTVCSSEKCKEVLVNVTSPSSREMTTRIQYALNQGATGIVVATPAEYRYEQRAVMKYFADALETAEHFPVYLYRKLGDPWGAEQLDYLVNQYDNLKGVKDSATEMATHLQLTRISGVNVYQGYEALTGVSVLAGGAGPVSGLATVLPEIVVEVTALAVDRSEHLWKAQERLSQIRKIVCGTNPYAAFKALLGLRGVPVGIPRRPFLALGPRQVQSIVEALESYGVKLEP